MSLGVSFILLKHFNLEKEFFNLLVLKEGIKANKNSLDDNTNKILLEMLPKELREEFESKD